MGLAASNEKTQFYTDSDADNLSWMGGKTILITGATNGLGEACINAFCNAPHKPAKVIILARNEVLAKKKTEQLNEFGIKSAIYIADFTSIPQIFAAAREIVSNEPVLHCAALNAGIFLTEKNHVMTSDNFETHYQVNFLQMVLLIEELLPLLSRSASQSDDTSRICIMGSFMSIEVAKGKLDLHTLGTDKGQVSLRTMESAVVYAQSKLAQHVWAKHAALQLPENVTINVCCPGKVLTNIPAWQSVMKSLSKLCLWGVASLLMGVRTVDEGCKSFMHLIGAEAMKSKTGKYLDWGNNSKYLAKYQPANLEIYPSKNGTVAPSTANPAVAKKLFEDTAAVTKKLREKYSNVSSDEYSSGTEIPRE